MPTGFKVLAAINKQLISAWVGGNTGYANHDPKIRASGKTRYIKNKWTKPKNGNGPLCIFKDIETARMWADNIRPELGNVKTRIYECEYKPHNRKNVWITVGRLTARITHINDLPDYTYMASAVKIIKRIK